jgi:O-6-methylguanine DNA methyltransferase
MNAEQRHPIGDSRALIRRLRQLGKVRAPAALVPTVLERLGLGDRYAPVDTPIGPLFVAYNAHGIVAVRRAAAAEEFERVYRARFGRAVRRVEVLPLPLRSRLNRHLRGDRRTPAPLDLRRLSPFERAVLLKVLEIPRGEVRPYAWVAREIGHPRAVRAVGAVLGRNPLPLLIPCHRVVRSDGALGGYIFGAAAKRQALSAEGVEVEALQAGARAGVRYCGSATARIYCFPTCRHARRIAARHRVPFRSEAEAAAAGYRPCQACRPARAS